MHHNPFFWMATVCIMLAMVVYVITSDLAFWPGHKAQQSVPAVAP